MPEAAERRTRPDSPRGRDVAFARLGHPGGFASGEPLPFPGSKSHKSCQSCLNSSSRFLSASLRVHPWFKTAVGRPPWATFACLARKLTQDTRPLFLGGDPLRFNFPAETKHHDNSETRTTLSSLQRFQSASLVTRRLAPQARATANWMASGVLNPYVARMWTHSSATCKLMG